MRIGPALDAVLRTTTIDESRAAGAQDAIVVGAGAAEGLAALLLAEGWPALACARRRMASVGATLLGAPRDSNHNSKASRPRHTSLAPSHGRSLGEDCLEEHRFAASTHPISLQYLGPRAGSFCR
jgi:hypothetical protein